MLFSQRYKDLIEYGRGTSKDNICGDIDFKVKICIVECLLDFAEPIVLQPDRYNPAYTMNSSAFEQALLKHNKLLGYASHTAEVDLAFCRKSKEVLASRFTPHLFDLMEMQYTELSDNEKIPFQNAINAVFEEHTVPWIMVQGRLVKIDSRQFELDVRNKALRKLQKLTDIDSQFLPSYDELIQACEFFEREEYGEAINNAEKSYESILKVICHLQRGNADKLTKDYITNRSNNLPVSMTGEGFREKVLMSLPYIRNNSASDHGAGATPVSISKPLAKLAVNMAAALNTYLIEEYTASIHFMENDGPKEDGGAEIPF